MGKPNLILNTSVSLTLSRFNTIVQSHKEVPLDANTTYINTLVIKQTENPIIKVRITVETHQVHSSNLYEGGRDVDQLITIGNWMYGDAISI